MNRTTTKQNLVAKILSICILSLLFCGTAFSQVLTGTKTIPGDYSSIANALTDINTNGVGTGGVTFNIAAGYTETITAKLLLTATGTVTDSIIFQKSGAGPNPLITAHVGTANVTSASPDGIWAIAGSDYVRIDGIDLLDPTTNTTATTSMEYGYGIFKVSATNGAQNNIIKNCTITLNPVNNTIWTVGHIGSTGILMHNTTHAAAATNITISSAAGRSAFNKFHSNTIKNCNAGISLVGYAASSPFTLGDTLNDVGGNSLATGNSIINFGGGAAAANAATGIYSTNQWGINCSYNTLNNNDGSGINHVNTLRGIYLNSATSAAGNCNYNTVTLKGGGTTQTLYAIDVEFGATATTNIVNINNNTVENCTYTTATSGPFYGIYASTTPATLNINNNIVRNNSISASTGLLYGINWTSPTNLSIQNNQVYSLSRSGAGTTGGIYSASGSTNEVINNNTVYDLTNTNTSSTSSTIYGIYQNTAGGTKEFKNNTVYNLSAVGSTATGNTIIGMNILRATTLDISSNTVYGISGTGSTVTGISLPAAVAGTYTAYKNKVYDLSSTIAAPLISGISIAGSTASTTFNIYNNLIGDLRASAASGADIIRGINITNSSATSTINVFYNTINISATSSGTNFGTSGIFHTTSTTATTATLNLRNNIIVNTSVPNGTGLTAAYRRSSTTLTNYATTSNNNLFYTDLTGNRTIFYDGTNKDSTISLFKTRMVTRDQASITENPTWVSISGSNTNFLNLVTSTPTQIESKALNITSPAITIDFNGNIRQGNVGYPTQVNGGGTAPDLGAWEFDGTPLSAPTISSPVTTPAGNQCTASSRTIDVTVTNISGSITSVTLNYAFNGVAQTPVTMTNTTGNIWEAIIPVASPANASVTWSVTATNSVPLSNTFVGTSYGDEPLTGYLTTISAPASPVCAGQPTTVSAIVYKPGVSPVVGLGATTSATYPNPFYSLWSNTHNQYLITAAELTAGGVVAGNITSLGVDITVTNLALNALSIKMANTTAPNVSSFLAASFTNVYSAATYTPIIGLNNFTFSSPFNWDGVSNVVIEICHGNSGSSATMNSTALVDNTSYVSTIHTHVSASSAGSATCADLTSNLTTYSIRPKFTFGGVANNPLSSYTWTDGSTTVGTGNPLIVSPTVNTSYSFTATDANGCSIASTTPASVTVTTSTFSGTMSVGAGQTYTTITDAVNAYNTACSISGPVVFELINATYGAGETFPIVISPKQPATASNGLTIRPASGNNVTISGKSLTSIFKLDGADYFTLDGSNNATSSRNLTIINDSNTTAGSAVIWLASTSASNGANNNSIKNCILQGRDSATTEIVVFSGGTTGIGAGTFNALTNNNNNLIQNNVIQRAKYGIWLKGTSTTVLDSNNRIINNQLGLATSNGFNSGGIVIQFQKNGLVQKNNVRGVRGTGGLTNAGGSSPVITALYLRQCINTSINANSISAFNYTGTGTNRSHVLYVESPAFSTVGNPSNNIISNNAIFDARVSSTGPSTWTITGLSLNGGYGDKIYFNTVNLTGVVNVTAGPAAAFSNGNAEQTTLTSTIDLRNNIFVINGSSTTTATFYSNYWQSAGYAGSTLNYNLLRSVSTASATANIGYNGSAQATLAAWKTATSQEANSINVDPLFASNTVLIPGLGSTAVAAGVAITNFTLDIVDSVRSNPPTIGAYDKAIDVSGPVITYTNLTNINQLTNRTVTGFATITDVSTVDVGTNKPRIYFKKGSDANVLGTYPADNNSSFNGWKYVEATNTTSPFNFTIDYSLLLGGAGVNFNDTILYFVVAQDALGNVSSNPSAGFTATSVSALTAVPTTPNGYLIVDAPMTGTYTVGVSGNYPNLNSAAFALNTRGVQGDVNFNIISNITEPATVVITQWTETGAGNYKLRITPTGTDTIFANSANSGAIVLFGADRVTIDGRIGGTGNNLTIVNTNTAAISVGVLVASAGTGLGCVNDSIVNVNILAGTNTANAIGIQAQGDNNNNLVIQNNVIKRAQIGVNVFTTNYPAGANTGLNISGNIIGDVSNTLNVNTGGINIANSPQAIIAQNSIFNVNSTASTNNYGIQVGSNSSKSTITGNKIDTITNASINGWGAYGINIAGSDTLTIANNIVTRIAIINYSTTSTVYNPFGIRVASGSGHRIYYNSVNLYGSSFSSGTTGTLSAALLTSVGSNLDIRNNIFVNSYVGISGSQSYAVYNSATTPYAIINNNNYYATGTYGVLGYYTTNRTTIAAWRTAIGQDVISISANPSFTSNNDLTINSGATANQMESAGVPVSVTTDFNGDPRPKTIPTSYNGNTAPDMGAIEFDGQPIDLISPTITYTTLANTSLLSNRSLTATITDLQSGIDSIGNAPRVYFKKTTDANVFVGNTAGDNGWKYTSATKSGNNFTATIDYSIINTGVVNVNDTIQYFVVAQDLATVPNVIANPFTGFVATSVSSITIAPTTPNYYVVTGAPLAGSYTVGAGGNFITLTDAVNNLNLRGVSANVTFELTDATYTTPAETFPLTINQISGANAGSRFTIKPSSGNTTTITGSNALSIIKLNGADYVTIDGSNNGTTTKDLTIINTSNTANSATIWLASLGANSGATNNKIQNTIINGASTSTVSVFGIYSAGNTISNTTTGEDNDTLTIDNNEFNTLGVGIYLSGTSTNNHKNITITNNTIGNSTVANTVISLGIYALRVNGLVIANNSIKNIVGGNTGSPVNSDGPEAILLETGVVNAVVTKNTIDNVVYTGIGGYAGKGIDLNTGIANSNIDVTNNMVSNIMGDGWSALGTDAIVGIRILGTTGNVRLYHNTVHLTGIANRTSATVSAAVYAAAGVTNLNVRNNIFMNGIVNNTTASKAFAAGTDITNPATITINYNNYFVYGTQGIFGYLGGDVASLTAWKAAIGQDANSINDSTRFVSLTNLHLTSTSIGNFSMKAAPISGVNTDIDNQARTAPFYYMGADEIPSSPLPVTLTSLTANVKENNVLVSWTTASEVNNKGFEVERSIDGTEFATIAFVKGAGNSSNVNSYSKLDLNAFNATASNTIYYRLKQVDFDGKYTYSQIVKVYKNLEAFSAVAIYPNPFVSQVTVSFNAATQSTAVIEILDIQGKVVATKTANTVNGANTVEVNNTDNLQAGIYFARLTLNGESQVIKLVKTN
ncbi:MAG: T9SS type A sorting domain-containing protein [Bacteroidota bacterium]